MLPVQLNLLSFCQTIAATGQYLFCLFDPNLPVYKHFQQFLIKQSWKEYIRKYFRKLEQNTIYIQELNKSKLVPYPDLQYTLPFSSVQDLQYYCQDIYCIDLIKTKLLKRYYRPNQYCTLKDDTFPDTDSKDRFDYLDRNSQEEFISESSDKESIFGKTTEFCNVDPIISKGKVDQKGGSRVNRDQGEGLAFPTTFSPPKNVQATSQ
jgi:hypothetical protein